MFLRDYRQEPAIVKDVSKMFAQLKRSEGAKSKMMHYLQMHPILVLPYKRGWCEKGCNYQVADGGDHI